MPATLDRMAKQKKTEPTVTVRVPESIAKDLRMIAGKRGVDVSVYLAEILPPLIDEHLAEVKEYIEERTAAKRKKPQG